MFKVGTGPRYITKEGKPVVATLVEPGPESGWTPTAARPDGISMTKPMGILAAMGPDGKFVSGSKARFRIGGAVNVGRRDGGTWLYKGESVQAGSLVYAACKSHAVTMGPDIVTNIKAYDQNLPSGILGQTIWDVYADPTRGNTGTAGIVAEPGTVLVHPVTNVSAYPGTGNGGDETIGSGRAVLCQEAPERSRPIGVVLETIVGKGHWQWTGKPVVAVDRAITWYPGGAGYTDGITTTGVRGEAGTFDVTVENGTVVSAASGPVGSSAQPKILLDTTRTYAGPQYKGNNAATISGNRLVRGGDTTSITEYMATHIMNDHVVSFIVSNGELSSVNYVSGPGFAKNTVFEVIDDCTTQAVFEFNGTTFTPYFRGSGYLKGDGIYEINIINLNVRAPVLEVDFEDVDGVKRIQSIVERDYGTGVSGAKLLLSRKYLQYESVEDENTGIVVSFPAKKPTGQQELVPFGPRISNSFGSWGVRASFDHIPDRSEDFSLPMFVDPLREDFTGCFIQGRDMGSENDRRVMTLFRGDLIRRHPIGAGFYVHPGRVDPFVGGSNYISQSRVSTFNLSRNTIVIHIVDQGTPSETVAVSSNFDASRYEDGEVLWFGDCEAVGDETKGAYVTLNTIDAGAQTIDITVTTNAWFDNTFENSFPTIKLDDDAPKVTVTAGGPVYPDNYSDITGQVVKVSLDYIGGTGRAGDIHSILSGNRNALFVYDPELPEIDLPADETRRGYKSAGRGVSTVTPSQYSDGLNLETLDVLVEMRRMPPDYVETLRPGAQQFSDPMPPDENIYKEWY